MLPLTVITGILLGSSAAIAVSLIVVLFLFFLLSDEYPHLANEFEPLATYTGLFLLMTVCSAFGFLGLVKNRPWRWGAQVAIWVSLVLIVLRVSFG